MMKGHVTSQMKRSGPPSTRQLRLRCVTPPRWLVASSPVFFFFRRGKCALGLEGFPGAGRVEDNSSISACRPNLNSCHRSDQSSEAIA